MQSHDHPAQSKDSQLNYTQAPEPDSELNLLHPHGLYIASLLLSAYEEFLENRCRLDATRKPAYNHDKNICTGGKDGELG
jgi:hypothetical protein